MRKQIKHGPEFVKDKEEILNRRVTRLLFLVVGIAVATLYNAFKT